MGLTERRWQRWARDHRLRADRAAELWAIIQRPQLAIPAHVVRVKARLLHALLEQLAVTMRTVQAYTETITDFFAGMPGPNWAASLPGAASGTTVPSVYAELGDAAVLDLRTFHASYCAILQEVWREVPVVWEQDRAVVRGRPSDHPCAVE